MGEPNHNLHAWQVDVKAEGQLGTSLTNALVCIQLHKIEHNRVQPPLPHVWKVSQVAC